MLRRILATLVWLGFASAGSRRRRGGGRDRFLGPGFLYMLMEWGSEFCVEIREEELTRREKGSFKSRRSVERW